MFASQGSFGSLERYLSSCVLFLVVFSGRRHKTLRQRKTVFFPEGAGDSGEESPAGVVPLLLLQALASLLVGGVCRESFENEINQEGREPGRRNQSDAVVVVASLSLMGCAFRFF